MGMNEFALLDREAKVEYVFQYGQFLAIRSDSGYIIALYYMNRFFAELYYLSGANQIDFVRAFIYHDFLEAYVPVNLLNELNL